MRFLPVLLVGLMVATVGLCNQQGEPDENLQIYGSKYLTNVQARNFLKLMQDHFDISLDYLFASKQYASQYLERPGMSKLLAKESDRHWEEGMSMMQEYLHLGGTTIKDYFMNRMNFNGESELYHSEFLKLKYKSTLKKIMKKSRSLVTKITDLHHNATRINDSHGDAQTNKKKKIFRISMAEHHKFDGDQSKVVISQDEEDQVMQKQEFTLDDWAQIYELPPHRQERRDQPTPQLVKYVKDLLPSEPARVLVPLCGKSPDLRWLYDRGNSVVGIEGVEKPVKEFFETHHDLQHSVEDLNFGKLYKSGNGRLQVFVCDVTKIPSGAMGHFNACFDWGAYTAILPRDRKRYVDVVKDAMKEGFVYFVEVCHDGPPEALGLPHSISFRTVKLEFGISFNMRLLETVDISEEWGVDTLFNSYILLSPKAS